jgi:hypothetical protein
MVDGRNAEAARKQVEETLSALDAKAAVEQSGLLDRAAFLSQVLGDTPAARVRTSKTTLRSPS